ncbi:MAG: tetratricopeptide repeat protein [Bacteroidetes bacterium]|nr:tetratricopeptide repeat protein [Bacteroidota bacterium]
MSQTVAKMLYDRQSVLPMAIIFLLVSIFISTEGNAENKDSLIRALPSAHDTVKPAIYRELTDIFFGISPDTALLYADSSLEMSIITKRKKDQALSWNLKGDAFYYLNDFRAAIGCYKKSMILFDEIKDTVHLTLAITNTGLAYYYLGDYNKTIEYYTKALPLQEAMNNMSSLANTYNNIGAIYKIWSKYEESVQYHIKSLKIRENIHDTTGMIHSLNNLGIVFESLDYHDKAIASFEDARKLSEAINDTANAANLLNNIGSIYVNIKKYSHAMKYYSEALILNERLGRKFETGILLTNIGMICEEQGKYSQALDYYKKSLTIREECNDLRGTAVTLNCIGSTLNRMKRYREATVYFEKSLAIAEETNEKEMLAENYEDILEAYTFTGDCEKAFKYVKLFTGIKDSIYRIESAEAVTEMQTKYETEKKEKEIELLNKEKEIRNAKLEKQSIVILAVFIGLGLFLILALVILIAFFQKRKANRLLRKQKNEIMEKNEELFQQNEEIATQRDEIGRQKFILEVINTEITDSIQYAQRIQAAMLPDMSLLKEYFDDYFILYRPKNIVSGDFFWATTVVTTVATTNSRYAQPCVSTILVVAVADCTGHGVPGAFMSVLGMTLLKEICNRNHEPLAGKILDDLRTQVIAALRQTGKMDEQRDGMDIALVCINIPKAKENTGILYAGFAGANNPLYVIKNPQGHANESNHRRKVPDPNQGDLAGFLEIRPDKMPIAIYPRNDPFTTHTFTMNKGDQFYLFSDGFPDQIGGPNCKKIKYKEFKRILTENNHKTMPEQKFSLEQTFDEWQNHINPATGTSYEQIDDICIVGIRV